MALIRSQAILTALSQAAQAKGSMLTQAEINAVYAAFPEPVIAPVTDAEARQFQNANQVLSADRNCIQCEEVPGQANRSALSAKE